jgi:hypothetical protein
LVNVARDVTPRIVTNVATRSKLRYSLRSHTYGQPMAESEVEAAWRAELERISEKQPGDALEPSSASKRQVAFHWLGDEVEARRLRQERAHHCVRWTLLAAIAAVIAILIAEGLTFLR